MILLEDNHLGSRLRLRAAGRTLSVEAPSTGVGYDRLMISFRGPAGKVYFKETYATGQRILCAPQLDVSGEYSLCVFAKPVGADFYQSVFGSMNGVPVLCNGKTFAFRASPYCRANQLFLQELPISNYFLSRCLKATDNIQSKNRAIMDLARVLGKGAIFPQTTMIKCYNWVAGNIAYDMDSLVNNRYMDDDLSSLAVLRTKRSVCSGYHNLLAALLRASGIPALGINCFSLGAGTTGWWYHGDNLDEETNHIITAAYVGQRWHVMDVTWGSDLRYEHGRLCPQRGLGPSLSFCDSTIPFISLSHRFDEYEI